jgi:hypothetical protein
MKPGCVLGDEKAVLFALELADELFILPLLPSAIVVIPRRLRGALLGVKSEEESSDPVPDLMALCRRFLLGLGLGWYEETESSALSSE